MSSAAVAMAGRSTLNPDAPLFIPAAYQRVEDFSPEWWDLIKTSTWFREHWLLQHQDQDNFNGDDARPEDAFEEEDLTNLLPEAFELDEFLTYSELQNIPAESPRGKEKPRSVVIAAEEALMKDLSLMSPRGGFAVKNQVEPVKYYEKPAQCVSPKQPRRIQQPR
ncbi:Protein EARLY RESPONSIVE TO DEHYDRATION 15 [Acorus calamus]|uniref:Protein EARLY RESPONSIVE TO DEHYDRATION 15 n=1 Tax=Acorus calamus TaxID=4465 RepID=A0AAV9F2K5_ACOCL|nr:Protein EARLY RESPONSIVE TO DEHYDRATION 15 [Acorus calamus]